MTAIATADRSRLHIRGLRDGERYIVATQGDGWLIQPEPREPERRKPKEWAGPKKDLFDHLDEMSALGFVMPEPIKETVGPCPFADT
jgi:hypothetical protein